MSLYNLHSSSDDEDYSQLPSVIRPAGYRRSRNRENVKRRPLRPRNSQNQQEDKFEAHKHSSDASDEQEELKKEQNGTSSTKENDENQKIQEDGDGSKTRDPEVPKAQSTSSQAQNNTNPQNPVFGAASSNPFSMPPPPFIPIYTPRYYVLPPLYQYRSASPSPAVRPPQPSIATRFINSRNVFGSNGNYFTYYRMTAPPPPSAFRDERIRSPNVGSFQSPPVSPWLFNPTPIRFSSTSPPDFIRPGTPRNDHENSEFRRNPREAQANGQQNDPLFNIGRSGSGANDANPRQANDQHNPPRFQAIPNQADGESFEEWMEKVQEVMDENSRYLLSISEAPHDFQNEANGQQNPPLLNIGRSGSRASDFNQDFRRNPRQANDQQNSFRFRPTPLRADGESFEAWMGRVTATLDEDLSRLTSAQNATEPSHDPQNEANGQRNVPLFNIGRSGRECDANHEFRRNPRGTNDQQNSPPFHPGIPRKGGETFEEWMRRAESSSAQGSSQNATGSRHEANGQQNIRFFNIGRRASDANQDFRRNPRQAQQNTPWSRANGYRYQANSDFRRYPRHDQQNRGAYSWNNPQRNSWRNQENSQQNPGPQRSYRSRVFERSSPQEQAFHDLNAEVDAIYQRCQASRSNPSTPPAFGPSNRNETDQNLQSGHDDPSNNPWNDRNKNFANIAESSEESSS